MRASLSVSVFCLCVFGFMLPACREKRDEPAQAAPLPEPAAPAPTAAPQAAVSAAPKPAPLVSLVNLGDDSAAAQLLNGFYEPQVGTWRWTAATFSAKLAVPALAAKNGGVLHLDLNLPKALVNQHPSVVVKAKVNEVSTSKTFSGAGDHRLDLNLPTAALSGESVVAEFSVDKPFLPGGADDRTLGVIAKSIELAAK